MLTSHRQARLVVSLLCIGFIVTVVLLRGSPGPAADRTIVESDAGAPWVAVAPGLELGRFQAPVAPVAGDGTITVLRIDPRRWDLKLLGSSELGALTNRNIKRWCLDHQLVAAINAGMYATDHRSHVGYMRIQDHINNAAVNKYLSAAAFGPRRQGLPPFRIFDLDETDLQAILDDYDSVIQNLRLIKRPGQNRWKPQDRHWSEAALGEDAQGRPLFIFTRSAFSMHDLNNILLQLPLDLVCAQHLEGGPEAQFSLHVGEVNLDLVGSFETSFMESDTNAMAWPVPNVIGVVAQEGARPGGRAPDQASGQPGGQVRIQD